MRTGSFTRNGDDVTIIALGIADGHVDLIDGHPDLRTPDMYSARTRVDLLDDKQ
jgi:hypothetical protein